MKWGLPLSLLCGLALTVGIWWKLVAAPDQTERELFKKLEALTSANPPQAADVVDAFELDAECATESCFLDPGNIASLQYSGGDIRPQGKSVIFVLEGFSGTCIRVDRVERRFGTAAPTQECSHGGCWYREAQYDWGIIGFGVKERGARCVDSVVVNTHSYTHPR